MPNIDNIRMPWPEESPSWSFLPMPQLKVPRLEMPDIGDLLRRLSASSNPQPLGYGSSPGGSTIGRALAGLQPQQPRTTPSPPRNAFAGAGADWVRQYEPIVVQISQETGVPADVILGIMSIEGSQGNPRIEGPETGQGRAKGLMQVMPFHFKPGEDPFDVRTNVRRGAEILARNYQQYQDWDKAAMAYFAGTPNPTARDVTGTSGAQYSQRFAQARQQYSSPEILQTGPTQDLGKIAAAESGDWQAVAQSQLGQPYTWGGASGGIRPGRPGGFDCSGFTSWLYKKAFGINMTAYTKTAYQETLPTQSPQPGDVVFFNMDNPDPAIQHMGIYIGNNQMINATRGGVQISPLWSNPEFRYHPQRRQE